MLSFNALQQSVPTVLCQESGEGIGTGNDSQEKEKGRKVSGKEK